MEGDVAMLLAKFVELGSDQQAEVITEITNLYLGEIVQQHRSEISVNELLRTEYRRPRTLGRSTQN